MRKSNGYTICLALMASAALVLAVAGLAKAQCGGGSMDHGPMGHQGSMGHQGNMGTGHLGSGNVGSPPAGSYSNPGPAPGTGTLGPYPAGSVTKDSRSNPGSGSAGARRPADASGPSGHQH